MDHITAFQRKENNYMDSKFFIPPNHTLFKAKKIASETNGSIEDIAIAYIEPNGGGPTSCHTHKHDHIFIVVEGCASIKLNNDIVKINKDEMFRVKGGIPHSVWNFTKSDLKMIGITVTPE